MSLTHDICEEIFDSKLMETLFPPERTNQFFEALLGDAEEGAYDIHLVYRALDDKELHFDLLLNQRPGKCLACNLTYGLPQVFSRHPIIDVSGLVEKIGILLGNRAECQAWQLGRTREISKEQHAIPLRIRVLEKQPKK